MEVRIASQHVYDQNILNDQIIDDYKSNKYLLFLAEIPSDNVINPVDFLSKFDEKYQNLQLYVYEPQNLNDQLRSFLADSNIESYNILTPSVSQLEEIETTFNSLIDLNREKDIDTICQKYTNIFSTKQNSKYKLNITLNNGRLLYYSDESDSELLQDLKKVRSL